MDPNPYESPSADPLGTNTAVGGAVSPRVVSELTGTKPWVRFLAVLAFLGAGFTILAGLGVSAAMMKQMGGMGGKMGQAGGPNAASMQQMLKKMGMM